MRILICTFTYPPNRDGVAAASEAMSLGLSARGHDVTIATTRAAGRSGNPAIEGGLRVYEFDAENPEEARRLEENARFRTWVGDSTFDVIICHCWYMWPAQAIVELGARPGPPVVLVSHGYATHLVDWSPRPAWGLGAWLRGLPSVWRLPQSLRAYAWVTFLSGRPDLGRFFDLWVAKWSGFDRFSVIPNGADAERFTGDGASFREAYGIREPLLFVCVANYSTRKNQKLAVRAFRRARLSGAALVLIGSEFGEYGREVQVLNEKLAATQPLGRVLLLEKVSQELTAAAYAACDVFVLSAKAETQPIVLLEAMTAGKPWVSTDTGCVRDLPGGVVVSGEKALAAALRRLAADPELRLRIGKEGKAASRTKYSLAKSVAAYDTLLRRLVPESSAPPHEI